MASSQSQDVVAHALENRLAQAAAVIEDQLDQEIDKLSKLDEDDLEALRARRLEQMKKAERQKHEYLKQGHGKYEEISEEKEFFDAGKKSKNLVCHFYRDSTFRCKIVDKHLALLAPKHLECRFIKLNVERAPFLTQRLGIRVLPTMCIVKDENTKDYIVGFDQLGGNDEFSTEMLEWRIAQSGVLHYSGDLMRPPEDPRKGSSNSVLAAASKGSGKTKKIIKGGDADSDSDLDDW